MSAPIDIERYRIGDHNKISRITAAHHAGNQFLPEEEQQVRATADIPDDLVRRFTRLSALVGDLAARIADGDPDYEIALARIHANVTHWLIAGQADRAR